MIVSKTRQCVEFKTKIRVNVSRTLPLSVDPLPREIIERLDGRKVPIRVIGKTVSAEMRRLSQRDFWDGP